MLTLHLITSFLVGGVFIALQTLVGERVHGFWRGVVLTIPSTMAIGLFFIGLTKSPLDVAQAAIVIPTALGPDYIFVAAFSWLSTYGLFISLIGSFAVWALGAAFILKFPPQTFAISVLYGLLLIFFAYMAMQKFSKNIVLKKFPLSPGIIFLRSIIGGTLALCIVVLSKTLGNNWGGVFSAFPGSFASALIIYYYWQGKTAVPAVAKTLFFPGAIGFMIYALTAAFAFPYLGIWFGTLTAYSATFVFFAIFYGISRKFTDQRSEVVKI